MRRYFIPLALTLAVSIAAAQLLRSAAADEPSDLCKKWNLPNSEIGNCCATFLETLTRNSQAYARDFFENNVAPSFRNMMSMDQHLAQLKKLQAELGDLEFLGLKDSSPSSASLTLRSKQSGKRFLADLRFDSGSPQRISSIDVKEVGGYGLKSDPGVQCASPAKANGPACCPPKKS